MHRIVASAIGLALLGGCSASPLLGPPAGRQFDGVYVGNTALLSGWGYQCGDPNLPREVTVRDGHFAYPFQVDPPRVTPVPVRIAADGSFHGATEYGVFEPQFRRDYRTGWVTVRGRITGNMLDATEEDLRCVRRSMLQRR